MNASSLQSWSKLWDKKNLEQFENTDSWLTDPNLCLSLWWFYRRYLLLYNISHKQVKNQILTFEA